MTTSTTPSRDSKEIINPKGISVPALTALVVGSMIGGGIFGLPSQMAGAAAPGPLLMGWTLTAIGMLMLAFCFQSLANRFPEIDGGVYGYARAGFGHYLGYCSAIGYWVGAWIGNVAFLVLLGSSIGTFIPAFGQGNTPLAIAFSSLVLWVVHFLVLRGVREATFVNIVVTIAKVVPLVVFVVVAAFSFNPGLLNADFWGTSIQIGAGADAAPLGGTGAQIVAMMLITVWVFSGVEGASIFSNRARRRSDVGKATVIGFIFVLALLILVNLLSYGVVDQAELAALPDPSLAAVLASIVGPWGAKFVSVGLIISLLGVLLSWVLLATEILRIPSQEGVLPQAIGRSNKYGTPSIALWMTSVCTQVTLVLTLVSSQTYLFLVLLASGTILIPYLWAALYQMVTAFRGERIEAGEKGRGYEIVIGVLAVLYTLWLIYAGKDYVLPSMATYFLLTPLYVVARREQKEKPFKPYEWAILGALLVGFIGFVVLVALHKVPL